LLYERNLLAVGFGNVWRFPSLAYKFGGGAFFIPYVMALFLIGIPVLFLEISLGQYYQRGDVSVFSGIHKRMRGVGLLSIVCGYILFTYYGMLVTWVISTLFESNKDNAPWGDENLDAASSTGYFYGEIVGMKTLSEEEGSGFYATRLVKENALYALLTMIFVFLCSAFGM
jgi:SNF family Na+-dependent transporter